MDTEKNLKDWSDLSAEKRADLMLAGQPFPSETPDEARCRLKRELGLMDDADLVALLDKSPDTLARMRVHGKGPTPIRVNREIFYAAEDVKKWIMRHRDVVGEAVE